MILEYYPNSQERFTTLIYNANRFYFCLVIICISFLNFTFVKSDDVCGSVVLFGFFLFLPFSRLLVCIFLKLRPNG